jgi:hypothetical protein
VTLHNPDPLEIDPRACAGCGLTIDQHEMVDNGEGPIFYCLPPDEMTLLELERRAELIRQIEVAAILARMEAADVPCEPPAPAEPRPYRPARSTVEAFFYLVRLDNLERIKAWLADRPKDAPLLLAMLESPASC